MMIFLFVKHDFQSIGETKLDTKTMSEMEVGPINAGKRAGPALGLWRGLSRPVVCACSLLEQV